MATNRKDLQKQHHGGASITQDSAKPTGSPGRPYTSGADVHKGAGGKPSKQAPAAQPKGSPFKE